jgi:Plavaka transposase
MGYIRQLFDPINCYQEIQFFLKRQKLIVATLPEGATVSPVILASDKTNLIAFSGDKQAWPIYFMIRNIDKHIR